MAIPELGSFLSQMKGISVFDGETFNRSIDETANGQHQVIITPEKSRTLSETPEYALKGVLKGGVNFATQANWGALELDSYLGGLVSNNKLLNFLKGAVNVTQTLGGTRLETELEDKKFYTGGGYITLPLEIRVLDDDNSGKVLEAAVLLMGLTTARETNAVNLKESIDKMTELLPESTKKIINAIGEGTTAVIDHGLKYIPTGGADKTSKLLNAAVKSAGRGVDEALEADIRLTEAPTTVSIEIGKWFTLVNMVIDNVSVAFSPNMSEQGPMFADFSIQASSRYKVMLGEKGFKRMFFGNGQGRVKIVKGQQTSNYA